MGFYSWWLAVVEKRVLTHPFLLFILLAAFKFFLPLLGEGDC